MWYVYILKSVDGRIYIGSTNDLQRRMKEHEKGDCYSTLRFPDFTLESYIAVKKETIARALEKYLKTGSGKAVLKKRILTDEALA